MIGNLVVFTGSINGDVRKWESDKVVSYTFSMIGDSAQSRRNKDKQGCLINCVFYNEHTFNYLNEYLAKNGRLEIIGSLSSYMRKGTLTHNVVVEDVKIIDFKNKAKNIQNENETLADDERDRILKKIDDLSQKHES